MKKVLFAIAFSILSLSITGCSLVEKEEVQEEEDYSIWVAPVEEAVNYTGFFAVRDGKDAYYISVDGDVSSSRSYGAPSTEVAGDKTDVIFRERDKDELTIPTVYADDDIIYIAADNTEELSQWSWKRYEDKGYGVAFRNVYVNSMNELATTNADYDMINDEEYTKTLGYVKTTDEKGNKIKDAQPVTYSILTCNGQPLSYENTTLADGGILTGITPDENGKGHFELFSGNKSYEVDLNFKYRTFENMENFWTHGTDYSKKGYKIVKVPKQFKSGYYTINDSGLFRYVNKPRAEVKDLSSVNFNIPFFSKLEEDGSIVKEEYYDDNTMRFKYDWNDVGEMIGDGDILQLFTTEGKCKKGKVTYSDHNFYISDIEETDNGLNITATCLQCGGVLKIESNPPQDDTCEWEEYKHYTANLYRAEAGTDISQINPVPVNIVAYKCTTHNEIKYEYAERKTE